MTVESATLPRWIFRRLFEIGKETGLVIFVITVWQFCVYHVQNSHDSVSAIAHGMQLWDIEKFLHVNLEKVIQNISHPFWPALNYYYTWMHFPFFFGTLIFAAFTPGYKHFRNAALFTTLSSFAIQFWVCAPLKFLGVGIIDTNPHDPLYTANAVKGMVDVYSAFPSLHVAWAFLIALFFWNYGKGLRILAIHFPITVWAVIATGNHSVLDCLFGVILAASFWNICSRNWHRKLSGN